MPRSRKPNWQQATSMANALERLKAANFPLPDYSCVPKDELPAQLALAELILFAWRFGVGLTNGFLRKPGGTRAFFDDKVRPLLSNAPEDLRKAVEAVPPMKACQPSIWRRDIAKLLAGRGFPEDFISLVNPSLLAPGTPVACSQEEENPMEVGSKADALDLPSSSSTHAASKREEPLQDAPRQKRAAPARPNRTRKRAKTAEVFHRQEDDKLDQQEQTVTSGYEQPPESLDLLLRALRESFTMQHVNPKTLKVLVGALPSKELADVVGECVHLQSRIGAMLGLIFERQAEVLASTQTHALAADLCASKSE